MPVVINTNYAASVAANNLSASNAMLQRSLNRLSSGSKIVAPSDDAGGLAVSMKLSAAAKRQGAQIAVLGNQVSSLQTQDGALKVAGRVLERMSELTALAADPTKGTDDTANYGVEFDALKTQLTSIAGETFNGQPLFSSGGADLDAAISGIGASDTATTSGIDTKVQTALKEVAKLRSANGASQSNIGFQAELLTVNKANLEAANSRIVDVDVADESTQLARYNILVQSGTAMLAQANQSAQVALKLLQ
jgi:flagellin